MNKDDKKIIQEMIDNDLDLARLFGEDDLSFEDLQAGVLLFERGRVLKRLLSQLDITNKKLDKINEIVSSYGIQTIPSGLGECPVEVPAYELNNIYKLSIIGGE